MGWTRVDCKKTCNDDKNGALQTVLSSLNSIGGVATEINAVNNVPP